MRPLPPPIPVPVAVSRRVLRDLRKRRELWRFLREFCRSVERAGGSAYLVGGTVRDLIEGRPGNDVDLMVTGTGFDALGRIVQALPRRELGIRRVVPAGKQFAVYRVATDWTDVEIDIALARSEHSTGPGHRQFAVRTRGVDAREDASRRDFTINSLMFSFHCGGARLAGEVIDFFGGMEDLRRKRIRGVGNPRERIREDPLRMLRAIRQKNERPGTVIEKATWRAIRSEAKGLIGTISGERLVGELAKSLSADPSGTLTDLYRAGILALLVPGIPDRGTAVLSRMTRRCALLERSLGRPLPETVMFANLLVDVARDEASLLAREACRDSPPGRRGDASRGTLGKNAFRLPRTEAIARGLHLPRVRKVVQMVEDLSRLSHFRMLRNPHARIEAIFGRWETPDHLRALYAASRRAASESVADFRRVLEGAQRRPNLLSGDDILSLGAPAGPLVETVLEGVREATLTGRISGREEAMRLAVSLLGSGRPSARDHRGRTRTSSRRVSSSPARARNRTKSSGIR